MKIYKGKIRFSAYSSTYSNPNPRRFLCNIFTLCMWVLQIRPADITNFFLTCRHAVRGHFEFRFQVSTILVGCLYHYQADCTFCRSGRRGISEGRMYPYHVASTRMLTEFVGSLGTSATSMMISNPVSRWKGDRGSTNKDPSLTFTVKFEGCQFSSRKS